MVQHIIPPAQPVRAFRARTMCILAAAAATVALCGALSAGQPTRGVAAPDKMGTADEHLRIIPALSTPSVKNGTTLRIQAVVQAEAGVREVTADIGGLARITLVADPSSGGCTPDARFGVYTAEWVATGLEEKVYAVIVRAVDKVGNALEDKTLRFSDPAAGNSAVGTTGYPNGSMRMLRDLGTDGNFGCAIIDTDHDTAYFGTRTVPGRVVKVMLAGPTGLMRSSMAQLETGEDNLRCAVYDPEAHIALFGTDTIPGRVVKLVIPPYNNRPERIGAVTLDPGEDYLRSAVLDPESGHAYFGTYTAPGRVVKIAQGGSWSDPPTRVGALTLNAGEDLLVSAVADANGDYAFFGAGTTPGAVVKVSMPDDASLPARMGAVAFEAGEDVPRAAVIDPWGGHAYFGTITSPGKVVKVALGAGAAPPTRVGSVTLNAGEESLGAAILDSGVDHAWFATGTAPGIVVKVAFGASGSPPSRVGALTLNGGEDFPEAAVINQVRGYGYFGTNTPQGHVVKVALDGAMSRSDAVDCALPNGENVIRCGFNDSANGYAYFGTDTNPAKILKVSTGPSDYPPERTAALTLNVGENRAACATVDTTTGYAYFGMATTPGTIVKVRKGSAAAVPERVGAVTLDAGENNPTCAVLQGSYAYFGTNTSPGKVVKVALGAADAAPTRVGALTLNAGENVLSCACLGPGTGRALFGTLTSPGIVVKVNLGAGAAVPTRIGAVTFGAGESMPVSAVSSADRSAALFGTMTAPGRVIKVSAGAADEIPTRVGATSMPAGVSYLMGGALDGDSGVAVFSCSTAVGHLAKVHFGAAASPPFVAGTVELPARCPNLVVAAIRDHLGQVILGTYTTPANVVKVGLFNKGFMHASHMTMPEAGAVEEVRFYSHYASGYVRLGVYSFDADPVLLWQSPSVVNSVTDGFVAVPVSTGTPPLLALQPGSYWLAWQTDSYDAVPSYMAGAAVDGWHHPRDYGDFYSAVEGTNLTRTGGVWTQYLTYNTNVATELVDDQFEDGTIAAPGAATGWSSFGFNNAMAWPEYNASANAYCGHIAADANHYRISGVISNSGEWLPYSSVGTGNFVRAKYHVYAAGQSTPGQVNLIPNLRVRVSMRFAQNSMLEVFGHQNGDPAIQPIADELAPTSLPGASSVYRVDLDPVDVPYLTTHPEEGICRAFEAYCMDPQDNGHLAMTESVLAVYPSSLMADVGPPLKLYSTGATDAGDLSQAAPEASLLRFSAITAGTGEYPAVDMGVYPDYSENGGGITMDSVAYDNTPSNTRIGIISREFAPGADLPARVRVEEYKQYKVRFHVTSLRLTNRQPQLRLRARTAKFSWTQKLEFGGAWAAGTENNTIAQQMLPGVGCQNPDKTGIEDGGWYNLIFISPMYRDLRPGVWGSVATVMPNLCAEPGPGVASPSKRDLKVGADLLDTLSWKAEAPLEAGSFTIDRIEVRAFNLVPD